MHFLIGLAVLWLLIEGIRDLRTRRKDRAFVREALRPYAGLSQRPEAQRGSLWDFIRYGC